MKRFLYAGLFLILVTLCSCSRKKAEASAQAVPDSNTAQVQHETVGDLIDATEQSELVDDSSEVDEEFLAQEERLGTEVLNFLEDEANFTSPVIEDIEKSDEAYEADETGEEKVPEVETVEKRLLDSYNRLKVMEYGSELFIPVSKDDSSIVVHYSDKNAVRIFYDNLYRFTKKEYWKMESVENAALTGTETYSYKDESKKPYEKIIESESSVFVSKLNENGLVSRTEKYILEDQSKDSAGAVKTRKLDSVTDWTYDEKNRITSETLTQGKLVKKQLFNYSKTDGLVQSTKVQTKEQQNQTDSTQEEDKKDELPPDYEYYENGILVTKTEYIEKGVYSTTIWFDSANSVRTDYKNYVKVREVYFTNGIERRVKSYE